MQTGADNLALVDGPVAEITGPSIPDYTKPQRLIGMATNNALQLFA